MASQFFFDVILSMAVCSLLIATLGVALLMDNYQENSKRITELRRYQQQDLQQLEVALKAKRLELIAKYPEDIASYVSMAALSDHRRRSN